MRSLRAFRLLRNIHKPPPRVYQGSPRVPPLRNGYCSACDAKSDSPTGTATALTNPPIPPADHRQLAVEQELFINSMYSPGSPLFGPNGARMFNKLTSFLRGQYSHFGFQEVITPTIYKKSLWEKSGHWENYKDDMFSVTGRGASEDRKGKELQEDEEYGLKPMNCPGHCLIFASQPRSYREMPVRYADFSPLHRNESSGSLSGLTRVRRFHQDDGHIFCRPIQIGKEISNTLEFVRMVYQTLGLGPYRLTLSTRPKDSFIGTVEEWDSAESALKKSLDASGQIWTVNKGDGAFYGPKIDIILKDSDGKEHQTATIQLDFQLPKRFELEYQAPAPEFEKIGEITADPELLAISGPVTPVLIHRAVLGSVERLMALLIEHYNGKYPFWLNPRQVIVVTVNDEPAVVNYAQSLISSLRNDSPQAIVTSAAHEKTHRIQGATSDELPGAVPFRNHSLAVELDDSPRSVKKKISEAKRKRYSVIIVVGPKNLSQKTFNVDFSAIPDPHGWIQNSASALCSPLMGGASDIDEAGQDDEASAGEASSSPSLDGIAETLRPEQLKNIIFHGQRRLAVLLRQIDSNYL